MTQEILDYGITGRNLSNGTARTRVHRVQRQNSHDERGASSDHPQPDAILRLQRVKDVPVARKHLPPAQRGQRPPVSVRLRGRRLTGIPHPTSTDYWPNALYDTREGLRRDESGANVTSELRLGGAMYYIELDTNNLAQVVQGDGALCRRLRQSGQERQQRLHRLLLGSPQQPEQEAPGRRQALP